MARLYVLSLVNQKSKCSKTFQVIGDELVCYKLSVKPSPIFLQRIFVALVFITGGRGF